MKFKTHHLAGFYRLLWSVSCCMLTGVPVANAQDEASLKARHLALSQALASNQFQRPLYLESSENSGQQKVDIYARLERPYALIGPALQGMDHWCDILILHLNVKGCRASAPNAGETISVNIGRKLDRSLHDAYQFDFLYRVAAVGPDYLQVLLDTSKATPGASRNRILLEVVKLDAERSFLHLSQSYLHGIAAVATLQRYLATTGRDKVGFSIVGNKPDGQPEYVGGMRGMVERNTMRYYLAIEAYLGALSFPAPLRQEKRLTDWHAAVERYPLQLHELERGEYLDKKREEIRRQRVLFSAATDP